MKLFPMVILCGGLSTRLGSLTEHTPKSMVEIEGKPFIQYQLEMLKERGFEDVILCIGHLAHKIVDFVESKSQFGMNVRYSLDIDYPLGTGGAVKNALRLGLDNFFVMYGDSYLVTMFDHVQKVFLEDGKLGTMVFCRNIYPYLRGNVAAEGQNIVGYDLINDQKYIDYGLSLFNKKAFLDIDEERFGLSRVHLNLLKNNQLSGYRIGHSFYEIGSPEGLQNFVEMVGRGNVL